MAPTRYVALLRGINVGGRNKVAMADLREAFEAAGHTSVSTYIQSGNVLFGSDRPARSLEGELEELLEARFGVPLVVVVRSHRQLRNVVQKAPAGFGEHPDRFHSDAAFLKGPLTSSKAMQVVRLARGRRPGLAGHRRALLRAAQRPPHPEPHEHHHGHPRVPADDDPQLEHDDEAAVAARRRSGRLTHPVWSRPPHLR